MHEPAKLRLVFCGTPQFAVPTLEALIATGHEVALAVTQPDRPVGRKQILTAPPVKLTALAHNISVIQPEKIKNNAEFRSLLEQIQPDAIVVVAYGRIIPKWMLDLPRLGCINLHGSLLPKYRGAAPIQWAIANGDEVLGNTTMLLEEGLDTGPMLLQQSTSITQDQTTVEAMEILSKMGAPLVVETLAGLNDGSIKPQPQDHAQSTLAPILTREDAHADFVKYTSTELLNRWRGFQPWPGLFTLLDGKKLSLIRIQPSASTTTSEPGALLIQPNQMSVACAQNTVLELLEIQPEGKSRMSAADFLRGNSTPPGTRLG